MTRRMHGPYIHDCNSSFLTLLFTDVPEEYVFDWLWDSRLDGTNSSSAVIVFCYWMLRGAINAFLIFTIFSRGMGSV